MVNIQRKLDANRPLEDVQAGRRIGSSVRFGSPQQRLFDKNAPASSGPTSQRVPTQHKTDKSDPTEIEASHQQIKPNS
ncbi:hypothetical protein GJ744_011796 [Endocarpon pusillum]|uniref:Uncharacterized protein n=1 Tax=Endocarpon pusillum TaxID=364733 RepID=A0A8H7E1Z1_9EURO|nr:hypothetical protein GJ744_011796 [Endocarpon pusillum]